MLLYRCMENMIQFQRGNEQWEVQFPKPLARRPASAFLSWNQQYVVFGNDRSIPAGSISGTLPPTGAHGLWIYDLKERVLTEVPHKVQPTDVFWEAAFDRSGALYYSDGNTFWRWVPGEKQSEKLFRYQRVKSAPMGMCVSADGRYIAYYKFKSDNNRLHLYDIQSGEEKDLRVSIFRFGWIDDARIAWTKSGGLKLLDAETGTSKTILRNYQAVLKKCKSADAALLSAFSKLESGNLFEDLDVLGFQDERIWFRLNLRSYRAEKLIHDGVWSVSTDGKDVRFHYYVPEDYRNEYHSGWSHQIRSLRWINKSEELQIWDGVQRSSFPVGWMPVFLSSDFWR